MKRIPYSSLLVSLLCCAAFGLALAAPSPPPAATAGATPVAPLVPVTPAAPAVPAVPAATPAAAPAAMAPAGRRLLSVELLKTYDRARRQRIQQALRLVFSGDPAYEEARAAAGNPLGDDVVGPVTVSFISRFWLSYNPAPVGNVTEDAVDALLRFAASVRRHPDWQPDVTSAGFGAWIERQPDRAKLYRIRLAADQVPLSELIARYRAKPAAAPAAPADGVDTEDAPRSVYWYGFSKEYLEQIAKEPEPQEAPAEEETEPAEAAGSTGDQDASGPAAPAQPGQVAQAAQAGQPAAAEPPPVPPVLPAPVKALLEDMAGMQYPRRSLFEAALVERLRNGLNGCVGDRSPEERLRLEKRRLSGDDLKVLVEALGDEETGAKPGLGERLQALWGDTECKAQEQETAVLQALFARYRELFDKQVRVQPDYGQARPLVLNSASCGCNTGNMKQEVYRFYPFWAGGVDQALDLSLATRVNFYGVTFDDNGDLVMANDNHRFGDLYKGAQAHQLDFVTEARRHLVKVDWVIHRTDWKDFAAMSARRQEDILDRLAGQIVGLLGTDMTDMPSTLLPWISLGIADRPKRGDGVTLYFDAYPDSDVAVEEFHKFVKTLQKELGARGLALNVMMRRTELGRGIYAFDRLARLARPSKAMERKSGVVLAGWARSKISDLLDDEQAELAQPHFLVLMDEPTSRTKKQLRETIELATYGVDRATLLRRIVPVINFDGKAWRQLQDDLAYFDQNYGGAGFWTGTAPAPAADDSESDDIEPCDVSRSVGQCLRDYFRDPAGDGSSRFGNLVCEFRWPLRILMGLLLLGAAATGIVYWRVCDARPAIEKYRMVHLAASVLAVLIFIVLLVCDPVIDYWSNGLGLPAMVGLLGVVACGVLYLRLKEREDQP